jgi:hypothetical protein
LSRSRFRIPGSSLKPAALVAGFLVYGIASLKTYTDAGLSPDQESIGDTSAKPMAIRKGHYWESKDGSKYHHEEDALANDRRCDEKQVLRQRDNVDACRTKSTRELLTKKK